MTLKDVNSLKPGEILFMNNNKIYYFIEQSSKSFIRCCCLIIGKDNQFNIDIVQLNIMYHDTLQSLILKKHCKY